MTPKVTPLADLLSNVHKLVERALFIGAELLDKSGEDLVSAVDERQRILRKIELAMDTYKTSLTQTKLSPAEQAFLRERRALLKDMQPRIALQQREFNRVLGRRLTDMRKEMAGFHRARQVIASYVRSPAPRPWVA